MMPATDHVQSAELEAISRILDNNPTISELAYQDLCRGRKRKRRSGANGMTADQVVRAAILKQMFNFTYQDLAFHVVDSISLKRFMRFGFADKGFKKSVLCNTIKCLSPQTWEAINMQLVNYASDEKIEKGRQVRIDCTVVESNIHEPSDSSLLFDSVRVLTRLLYKARDDFGLRISFTDHTRRAKRRNLAIINAKTRKARQNKYADLLKVTRKTIGYADRAIKVIDKTVSGPSVIVLRFDLNHFIELAYRIVDQTERRVMLGQKVPSTEKVVSIFEEHTDVIVKDSRDTHFGHKICLTGGASNLIVDCLVVKGNPAKIRGTV